MEKKVCIMCGKERDGLRVKEDNVIRALRWFKRNVTKNPKSIVMVVCKDDFLEYKKKREGYERKQILYVAIGVVFMIFLLIFSGGRVLGAVFYGIVVIAFMYLLSLLSYMPAVEMPAQKRPRGLSAGKRPSSAI